MRKTLIAAVVVVISAIASAQPQPPAGANRIRLQSKVMGEERAILVRTPAGYENGSARFPVLYLTDGDFNLDHTAATVDFLSRNGRIPQMIVVGISNTDRTRDLTPTRASLRGRLGDLQEFPTAGGADRFLQFIETELIPYIESNYRTHPYRVFAGHSFGGMFALHALTRKPELFGGIISASPTLTWDEHLPIRRTRELLKSRKELKNTLYLTIGNEGEGLDKAFNAYRDLLRDFKLRGFSWAMDRLGDEDHGSLLMPTHYAGLRKVFDGWQLPRDENGAVRGGWKGITEHYRKLSDRFGYTIPVPEGVANFAAYQIMAAGKLDEAIEIFRWNVRQYPESANPYDSLGEAYEKAGKLDLARENYARAAELGKKNNDPNTAVYQRNYERVAKPQ